MELRDKNGLTEAEFLQNYRQKDYPQPSLTADLVVVRSGQQLELLLIRRGGHPYLGYWALPGGFVELGEDARTAAHRELEEETGLRDLPLAPLGFYSNPGRDPRGWVVTATFLTVSQRFADVHAADDAVDAAWFVLRQEPAEPGMLVLTLENGTDTLTLRASLSDNPVTGRPEAQLQSSEGLAFDHAQMIADAWLCLAQRQL